jgi:uridylate kinase
MRLVIKVSGEGLSRDGEKYSEQALETTTIQVKKLLDQGNEIALIIGGGNLFRGRDLGGKFGVKRATADYVGMLATVQNALVVRDFFESKGMPTVVMSAIPMQKVCEEYIPRRADKRLKEGKVVIFAGGLGAAYFSTDSCAVQRSLEMGAEMLIMAKNGVEGIYSADPRTDKTATFIKNITASEVIQRNLNVADFSAMGLAKEQKLKIKIVASDKIDRALDPEVGSMIEP